MFRSWLPRFFRQDMLTKAQIQTDFDRQVSLNAENKATVVFDSQTAYGIKSAKRESYNIDPLGDTLVISLSVWVKADAFTTAPTDNDQITVDGVAYQVAMTSTDSFGAKMKIALLDPEA